MQVNTPFTLSIWEIQKDLNRYYIIRYTLRTGTSGLDPRSYTLKGHIWNDQASTLEEITMRSFTMVFAILKRPVWSDFCFMIQILQFSLVHLGHPTKDIITIASFIAVTFISPNTLPETNSKFTQLTPWKIGHPKISQKDGLVFQPPISRCFCCLMEGTPWN